MRKLKFIFMFSLILIAASLMLPELHSKSSLARSDDVLEKSDKQIVRVYFPDRYTANKIFISFETMILETNYEKKYHIMAVTPEEPRYS